MKIAILGSTGFVGKELLKKSIEQGHEIKVLVRNPKKLGELVKIVEVVEGDYFDKVKVAEAIADTEIVISTIGPPTTKPEDIDDYTQKMTCAMKNLVSEMKKADIRKIILIGGCATSVKGNPAFNYRQKFIKLLLNLTAKHIIAIKNIEYEILSKSNLDWIIVRPPVITKGSPTNNVKADEQKLGRLKIDINDLVDFILKQITSETWVNKNPLVCSMKE